MQPSTNHAETSQNANVFLDSQRKPDLVDEAIAQMKRNANSISISNVDKNDPEDMLALLTVEMVESKSLFKQAPVTVNAKYIILKEFESIDKESGEISGKIRTSIVDAVGTVWTTNSPSVSGVMLELLSNRNARKRFEPPLQIQFKTIGTMGGGSVLRAFLDVDNVRALLAK